MRAILDRSGQADERRGLRVARHGVTESAARHRARPRSSEERWTHQWKELYAEVITSGLCTGCAGCVIACPHDVIGYDHEPGGYKPFHLEEELGLDNCIHGEKGCTSCTRACPRFRAWEPEADEHLFGRVREPDEMSGIYQDILLMPGERRHRSTRSARTAASCRPCSSGRSSRATSTPRSRRTSRATARSWKAIPGVARNKEEILASAGSPLHVLGEHARREAGARARASRSSRSSGMSCQTSVPPIMWSRKVGKVGQAVPLQHRAAVLEDVRRRHLRGAVPGEVRPAQGGDGEDEHQGRVPDLDEGRRVPRDRPQGVPRSGRARAARLPRLRGRARRHLHRRHRRVQRLDAHDRAHRPRSRDHRPHDRGRLHREPGPPTPTRRR